MSKHLTFEYYSTFSPVSDPFTAESPKHNHIETDTDLLPLQMIDNSYIIYSRIVYKPLTSIKSQYFS